MKLDVNNRKYQDLQLESNKMYQYKDGNIEICIRDSKTTWVEAIIDLMEEELIDLIKNGLNLLKNKQQDSQSLKIMKTCERILSPEDSKKFDEIYDYVDKNRLNKLKDELNKYQTDPNYMPPFNNSELTKQVKSLEKSKEYKFNDKERYGKFYKRILEEISKYKIDSEDTRKKLTKEELIKLKRDVVIDDSIELTAYEIEELIQQIDKIILADEILKEAQNKSV